MEVKKLKEDKNILILEILDGGIGFANLIKEELWRDKGVDEAASIKEHPYMAKPKIYVKMKGNKNPKLALMKATKRLQVMVKDLKGEVERALKD